MNTAVYGGAFNPFHLGHRHVVRTVLARVDHVYVVPCAVHPFGKHLPPLSDRVNMAVASLSESEFGLARATVSDIEQHLPTPNYTLRTLEWFARAHPGDTHRLVVGPDVLHDRDRWFHFDEIVDRFGLIEVPEFLPVDLPEADPLRHPPPPLRASEIRKACERGEPPVALLGPAVCDYIRRKGLYLPHG